MDLDVFRKETRDWLASQCPESMRTAMPGDEYPGGGKRARYKNPDTQLWMQRCAEKGYTTPTWPKQNGGAG